MTLETRWPLLFTLVGIVAVSSLVNSLVIAPWRARRETKPRVERPEGPGMTEEERRYIVSVHFNGLIREEDGAAAQPFAEVWHMTKPRDGSRGWVLAGIQQVQ